MIVIVGAGVAGMSAALAAADALAAEGSEVPAEASARVVLVTPGLLQHPADAGEALAPEAGPGVRGTELGLDHDPDSRGLDLEARVDLMELAGGNTARAQGGIAAAIGDGDTPDLHLADTIAAGAGLVDVEAATVLTREGAQAVRGLIAAGFAVDRDATGAPSLGLEAAHSRARIVHAGEDQTGLALHRFLTSQVRQRVGDGRIVLLEQHSATGLVTDEPEGGAAGQSPVTGVWLRDAQGREKRQAASAVILATGGYAALYARTSNHPGAVGSGIALAAAAGALTADLEFVQFHPTALAETGFLVSEAVRGAGAVIRDAAGRRFLVDQHPDAELAPRDVVSRLIFQHMQEHGVDAVWLDATGIEQEGGPGTLERRFPAITCATRELGYRWEREAVPVAPAAHYTMGGVATDLDGRTSVPGLFAAGEVASTGVHGANRLASNSLLEGLVFGSRAGDAAVRRMAATPAGNAANWALHGAGMRQLVEAASVSPDVSPDASTAATETADILGESRADDPQPEPNMLSAPDPSEDALRDLADSTLGILRSREDVMRAERTFLLSASDAARVGAGIARAALLREESRGAHQRSDFPETREQSVRIASVLPGAHTTQGRPVSC